MPKGKYGFQHKSTDAGEPPPPPRKHKPSDPSSKLANEQTFLQLLVAQIKNQDPLNPTDGMQFVCPAGAVQQLEQTINVGQDVDAIRGQLVPPTDVEPDTKLRRISCSPHFRRRFPRSTPPPPRSTWWATTWPTSTRRASRTSVVYFRDLVTQSLGAGLGETQVGFGTGRPLTIRQFTQGAIQTSTGLLDAAIQGDGFFVVKNAQGNTLYTRAGNFQVDRRATC